MADDVLLDTNVILRLLRADQPSHFAEARRLFEQAREGKVRLLLPTLVIAEVVFMLQGFYRVGRAEILKLLQDLVATPNLILLEPRTVVRAAEIFGTHPIDFVDAYLVALAEDTRTATLATFNKRDFRRFPQVKLIP